MVADVALALALAVCLALLAHASDRIDALEAHHQEPVLADDVRPSK